MVIVGVGAGILISLGVTRLVEGFLYGVEPNDPGTLAFAAVALIGVAVGAAAVPARRAARLDPIAALRDD